MKLVVIVVVMFVFGCGFKHRSLHGPERSSEPVGNQNGSNDSDKDLSEWDIESDNETGNGFELPYKTKCLVTMDDSHSDYEQYAIAVNIFDNQRGSMEVRKASNFLNKNEKSVFYNLVNSDPKSGSSFHSPNIIDSPRLTFIATLSTDSRVKGRIAIDKIGESLILTQSGVVNHESYVIDQTRFTCE